MLGSNERQKIQADSDKKIKRGINRLLFQRFKSKRNRVVRATLIIIAIVMASFVFVLLRETNLVRQRYANAELTKKIKDLKLANESRKEQLAKLFDAKTLTEKANEIGLEKPGQEQIIYVPVPQINQLAINLQAANAENWQKKNSAVDYKLIYKNLADYYEQLHRGKAGGAQTQNSAGTSDINYADESADGVLLRQPNQVDAEYLRKVKENANAAKATAKATAKAPPAAAPAPTPETDQPASTTDVAASEPAASSAPGETGSTETTAAK